jgi:hypothetical protein
VDYIILLKSQLLCIFFKIEVFNTYYLPTHYSNNVSSVYNVTQTVFIRSVDAAVKNYSFHMVEVTSCVIGYAVEEKKHLIVHMCASGPLVLAKLTRNHSKRVYITWLTVTGSTANSKTTTDSNDN